MKKTRIICVDDERHVLDAIAVNLRKSCEVLPAGSGAEALKLLDSEPDVDVIMSDMRMPGMDGATLLAKACELKPDIPRILLTGQADLASAIAAVNNGQLFRFLTKPCAREQLEATIAAAVEHHRLVTAERVLLEKTLHGSVAALTDILAMTNPALFGRASRIKTRVSALAAILGVTPRWQVEMAAMLQPIGYVVLPPETVEKVRLGQMLDDAETKMVARIPTVTNQLLAHIPRLDDVRAILLNAPRPSVRAETLVEKGAGLLRLASELDDLEAAGKSGKDAVEILRGRTDCYAAELIQAAAKLVHEDEPQYVVREIASEALRVGMTFADDVKLTSGTLLVARGFQVNASFIERVRNYPPGALRGPLRILVRV